MKTVQNEAILTPHSNVKEPASAKIVLPIQLGIDPMERLLVADFKGDSEYEMIEPQLFDDSVNGKGLRMLFYRKDKKVDVYWQPGVNVDRNSFNIGAGVGVFTETNMNPAQFKIDQFGVNIEIAFNDSQGRRVEFVIEENTTSQRSFPFLAPVGNGIENPKQFFLVYMLGFDFVKRHKTYFHVKIGDRVLTPSSFPILREFRKVYFTRYASKLLIGVFNPPMTKPVEATFIGPGSIRVGEMKLIVNKDQDIEKIYVENSSGKIKMDFSPFFPNLLCLKQNENVKGQWKFTIAGVKLTGGTYSLLRTGEKVDIGFDVLQKWHPVNLPFSFKLFTFIARSFRTWPTTYKWTGTVDLGDELSLSGAWKRI